MSAWRSKSYRHPRPTAPRRVEIVVPIRDEERDLGPGVRRLAAYLSHRFPFRAMVTIADNGSADGTWAVAQALAGELDGVRAVRLARAGRGPGGGGPGGTGPGGARIPGVAPPAAGRAPRAGPPGQSPGGTSGMPPAARPEHSACPRPGARQAAPNRSPRGCGPTSRPRPSAG